MKNILVAQFSKTTLILSGFSGAGVLAFLIVLNTFSPYPGVTPDEMTYQRQSYFPVPGEIGFGNPLFSWTYSFTALCGDAWYECVKGLNLIFFASFTALLALFAWYSTRSVWALAASLSVVAFGPFSSYTSYFMPDTMLAATVVLSIVTLAYAILSSSKSLALAGGFVMALAMLVKPHAFFIWIGLLAMVLLLVFLRATVEGKLTARLTALFLACSISVRSFFGILIFGLEGLNPLAGYFNLNSLTSLFRYFSPSEEGQVSGEAVTGQRSSALYDATISAVTNLAPAVAVSAWLIIITYAVFRIGIRSLITSPIFQLGLTVLVSLALMSAAFGALLELREAEETIFRALTRYWEYSLALFLVFSIVAAFRLKQSGIHNVDTRFPFASTGLFVGFSAYLLFLPRPQTAADSGLLYATYEVFVGALFLSAIAVFISRKQLAESSILLAITGLIVIGGVSDYRLGTFLVQEKSGVIAGQELIEIMKRYPQDLNDIAFIGESSPANTAAFMAQLPYTTRYSAGVYDEVEYQSLKSKPRWVFASKEISVSGNAWQTRVLGDVVMYEFGNPSEVNAAEFDRYNIEYDGALLPTYWGAWTRDGQITITLPKYFESKVLEIGIIVSDELEDTSVEIDYGEGPIEGSVEADQVITPIILSSPSENFWSSRSVTIRYTGDSELVERSTRRLSIGIESIRNYDN